MERTELLDFDRLDAAVCAARAHGPWPYGPRLRGCTRDVFVDEAAGVTYKVDRVRGSNVAERFELELTGDLDGIPDWTFAVCGDETVIVMVFVTGARPAAVEVSHPLVRALSALNADLHPGNFVVDAAGKLWCIDLGS